MDNLVKHYLIAALWTSTDENDEPFDWNYTIDDIAPLSIAKAEADCKEFLKLAEGLLEHLSDEAIGHDFWLTRNHHGAGFWDRDLGAVGETLTDIAHSFGSCDPYVGDDGKVYLK